MSVCVCMWKCLNLRYGYFVFCVHVTVCVTGIVALCAEQKHFFPVYIENVYMLLCQFLDTDSFYFEEDMNTFLLVSFVTLDKSKS